MKAYLKPHKSGGWTLQIVSPSGERTQLSWVFRTLTQAAGEAMRRGVEEHNILPL